MRCVSKSFETNSILNTTSLQMIYKAYKLEFISCINLFQLKLFLHPKLSVTKWCFVFHFGFTNCDGKVFSFFFYFWLAVSVSKLANKYVTHLNFFQTLTDSASLVEESCESTLDNNALTSSLVRFWTGLGLGSLTGSGLGSRMGSGLGSRMGSGLGSLIGSGLGSRTMTGSGLGSRGMTTIGSGLGSLSFRVSGTRSLYGGTAAITSSSGSGVGSLSGVAAWISSLASTSSYCIPFT